MKEDDSIERYKARLVARGFTQTRGVNSNETFAPVTQLDALRHTADPSPQHEDALFHLLGYLQHTIDNILIYRKTRETTLKDLKSVFMGSYSKREVQDDSGEESSNEESE